MEYSQPQLFNQGPSALVRLVFFVLLSLGLLIVDARFDSLEVVRKSIGAVLYPAQQMVSKPILVAREALDYIQTVVDLKEENQTLVQEVLHNQNTQHELYRLRSENTRLRDLLEVASEPTDLGAPVLSEVISDSSDPFSRKVILDKGSIQGLTQGMPVIDAVGLIGQITRTGPGRAEVSLVTDKDQIIPVENSRSGVRSLAYGGVAGDLLELRFMSAVADIEEGDLLVTSGLDGEYPRGIPVAEVIKIRESSRYTFATILCKPVAGVNKHRFVLAINNQGRLHGPPRPTPMQSAQEDEAQVDPSTPSPPKPNNEAGQ